MAVLLLHAGKHAVAASQAAGFSLGRRINSEAKTNLWDVDYQKVILSKLNYLATKLTSLLNSTDLS